MSVLASLLGGVLAAWLLWASWTKLRTPAQTSVLLSRTLVRNRPLLSVPLSRGLAAIEAITAIMLLLRPQIGAVLAAALFLGFTIYVARYRNTVKVSGCGCGGTSEGQVRLRWVLFTRVLGLASALVVVTTSVSGSMRGPTLAWTTVGMLLVFLLVAVLVVRRSLPDRGSDSTSSGNDLPRVVWTRRALLARGLAVLSTGFFASSLRRLPTAHAVHEPECMAPDCCNYYYCISTLCWPFRICIDNKEYEECLDVCTSGKQCGKPFLSYIGPC